MEHFLLLARKLKIGCIEPLLMSKKGSVTFFTNMTY
jgi:hypothetical protein